MIDYFDTLIDEVDFKAEKLLAKFTANYKENINEQQKSLGNLINKRRNLFIETIEGLKRHNIECLNKRRKLDCEQNCNEQIDGENIFNKYCFILDKYDFDIANSTTNADDLNQSDLDYIDENFGYLIVIEDGYVSERKLSLFKEIIFNGYLFLFESEDEIGREQSNKFYKKIDTCQLRRVESNIFNAKLNDVLVSKNFPLN